MKTDIKKEKLVEDIIKKLKPNLIKIIKKKDYNFMKDDLLDSFHYLNKMKLNLQIYIGPSIVFLLLYIFELFL